MNDINFLLTEKFQSVWEPGVKKEKKNCESRCQRGISLTMCIELICPYLRLKKKKEKLHQFR